MSQDGSRVEVDNRSGLILAAIVGIALALALYPPLVIGGVPGFACGHALVRRQTDGKGVPVDRKRLVAGAVGLVVLALIGEATGLSERAAFLEQWRANGLLHLDVRALIAYPWAWIVPSAAVAATVVAATVVWRDR